MKTIQNTVLHADGMHALMFEGAYHASPQGLGHARAVLHSKTLRKSIEGWTPFILALALALRLWYRL